jgi:dihydrofolate reductase
MLEMILATAIGGAMGNKNGLPWPNIPEDMKWFREKTRDKVVVMGSNTWFSLPEQFRPLPFRTNVVISTKDIDGPDMVLSGTPDSINDLLLDAYPKKEIILIGGKKIYEDFFPHVNRVFHTLINKHVEHDTQIDIGTMLWTNGFHRENFENNKDKGLLFEEWVKK